MQLLRVLLALCAAQAVVWPAVGLEEYQSRREALRKALPDGVTVLFGRGARESDRSGFFQEPGFYYLSGWREPDAVLLVAPGREILFLPPADARRERYDGKHATASEAGIAARTGFEQVLTVERLEAELRGLLERVPKVYTRGDAAAAKLRALAPLREVVDARAAMAGLRMKKSPEEIRLLEKAVNATAEAHRAAWRRAAPGLYEYQVAATMTAAYLERGCERHGYPPIVGSGPNAVVLHYSQNKRRMDRGELLLMDVGAECGGYVADITRTIPVSGKFSRRQKEIYQVVLGAQKAALKAVKPGVTLAQLTTIAKQYMDAHGGFGRYFLHGIGHHVGLEVHDADVHGAALEEGHVITIEPGIYIAEEGLGVRIEDMVQVTRNGARLLSAELPREAEEIEEAMGKRGATS